jgi:hypothetical protein
MDKSLFASFSSEKEDSFLFFLMPFVKRSSAQIAG